MKKLTSGLLILALVACDSKKTPETPAPSDTGAPEASGTAPAADSAALGKDLLEVYTAAGDWLVSQQGADGSWSMGPEDQKAPSPSYTSMMITSMAGAPKVAREHFKAPVEKALAYLVSKANDDGSFGEGPRGAFLKTYTTALALQALATADKKKYADLIRGAQAYLKQNQLKEGPRKGGLGYGDLNPKIDEKGQLVMKKKDVNMSILGFAADALHVSDLPQDDKFWELAADFARKCQNSTEVNTDPQFLAALKEQGLSVGNDGGLYYEPSAERSRHKAGTIKIADKETIVSYGSMTYEGIKTYIYAGLSKDSPEVMAATDWVRKNYSVEAHPGFPYDKTKRTHQRGLYYYYLAMARAMHALGENPFRTIDGKKHDWPRELAAQFIGSVRESKMWKNDNPSWYEGDPVMVTSFVLMTCDVLFNYIEV